jgi:hypothetical protein
LEKNREKKCLGAQTPEDEAISLFAGLLVNPDMTLSPEKFRLRTHQRIIATTEDSVLRTEMGILESQEVDAPRRVLRYKTMSWLGKIRPHRRDEAWYVYGPLVRFCGDAALGSWFKEVPT